MSTSKHLLDVLTLTPDGDDAFVGHPQVIPSGRIYGGELVAQAQVAMAHTVGDDRRVHSLHGYFLRAGDVQQPTRWVVQRLRDGRNFSARTVSGMQGDRVLFHAMASFQVPGTGVEHQDPIPDLPDPESLPTSEEALEGTDVRDTHYWSHDRSFDIRHAPAAVYTSADGEPSTRQTVWLRAWETLPDDPALHRSALAYVCDYTMLEPVLRRHGAAWADDGVVTASLDHAMWWHHDGRMDGWVALVQESPIAMRGLGLGTARLYAQDGSLLASVVQEGLVHLPDLENVMTELPFWNPKTEQLPREELRGLQLTKLRLLAEWAQARSPHYKRTFAEAGFRPEQLRTWADIDRIPFLTREEWMRSQDEHPPYGELPVVGPEAAIRVHTTSGTSGRTPLRALDSRKDWSWAAEMWCYALWAAGVRPRDVGYVAFGYGSFIGFWGLHNGLEKLGALTVPGGAQTTPTRIKQIVDFGATVVASTPTYALRLSAEAEAMGVDLRNGPVHTVILSGEPVVAETKAIIEERWGAKAYDTAGMTEISTIFMFEPADQPGGSHIIEDHFIEQVVDPETGRELGYGERGERVCTSFGRSTTPLLRYRTADMVVKVPSRSARTWDIYQGGIIGRVDDMKLVRGTNVYPGAIENIVRGFEHIEEFQVRIERRGDRDEIILVVEPGPTVGDEPWGRLADDLCRELADAHEGLRFHIERAAPGALPRFELKAKRLTDLRSV